MHVQSFYDDQTSTFTHVVVDPNTSCCAVIDSVMDYNQDAAKVTTDSADAVIRYIRDNDLNNQWLLETHIHADHISAAHYLKQHMGGQTAIGSGIRSVLRKWVPLFDTGSDTPIDGSQFDCVFDDGAQFKIGELTATVIHTPGHTPACATYEIGGSLFVGDTLFHPDTGTARVDFPGGSAAELFNSIQRLYQYPEDTILYLCHDYPDNRKVISCITVGEQMQHNKMIQANTSLSQFQEIREQRDQMLAVPKLILPSIQTNMRLGDFGPAADNGIQYIRIPINQL